MTQQTAFFPLGGGMDLITPAVSLPPGRVVAALNYEPTASGYRRLRGYERFDGNTSPSSIDRYWILTFNSCAITVPAGSIITSGGRRACVAEQVISSGTVGAGDAAGYYVLYRQTEDDIVTAFNTFPLNLSYSASDAGTTTAAVVLNAVPTGRTFAELLASVRESARAKILAVPGSGPVRGVWFHRGRVYAVRDNPGATAGIFYEADPVVPGTTWVAANIAKTFSFNSGGTTEITLGVQVDGATSGAQGFVSGIFVTSGTWAGGDAAGTIQIVVASGTYQNGENLNIGGGGAANVATLTNAGTTYALPAGGAYEFITHNFYGSSDRQRVYATNGVGPAIVFSQAEGGLAPISTGMANDTPTHLAAHRGSLFLTFPGGSVQFSTVGDPQDFSPVTGAGELGIGSDITALVPTSGALAILAENSIGVLYGNDSSDYVLETLTLESGALPHTAQKIGQVVYMDNRGLRSLATTQSFGNFSMGALSRMVEPLLRDKRTDGVLPAASFLCRTQNQYWLAFDDDTGFIAHFGKKEPEILPFDLGITITCACSAEVDGEERIFVGSDDGFVYELNKGTSFDGEPIEHYVALPYNHFGAPQQNKRIHKVIVDLEASGATTIEVSARLNQGSIDGIEAQTLSLTTGGAAIDDLGSNELYFASQIETQGEAYLGAFAKNISLKIGGETDDEEPHTLTGVTFHISPRGLQR